GALRGVIRRETHQSPTQPTKLSTKPWATGWLIDDAARSINHQTDLETDTKLIQNRPVAANPKA
ncbi:MAG TPA: hypothetical protein V6D46_06105, partial [Coleofasciculaceae cyanobacterium]